MDIERTFQVAAPQGEVWEFITSPERVAPCLPGCEGVEMTAPGQYRALIKVKVGPIKTSFKVEVETVEERPPEFAAYRTRGEEGGKASRINADSTLALAAIDDTHTEVTYTSKINVVGRLGKFAGGVMKKMAESMSDQFVAALRERVEPPAATASSADPEQGGDAGVMGKVSGYARKVFGRGKSGDAG